MKCFGICLISLALVAYGESRIAGETPAGTSASLNDLITQAQAHIAKLGKELHANLNLPDEAAVVNTLKNHSSNFVNNIKTYVNQMSDQVKAKSPELEKLWSSVKATMTKVTDDMVAQIPVAKDQVAQLEAKFFKGVDTIVKQTDLVAQTLDRNSDQIQDDFSKITKKVVDMAVDATQQLNSQVQQHASAKPKA